MTQQTTTGAARARRAGLDPQRLSHPRLEPNPALVQAGRTASEEHREPSRGPDHRVRRVDAVRLHPHRLVQLLDRVRRRDYPYGLLTMIVSLEAIFLSTFVMISQNRADAKRQVIADQQWQTVKEEDRQNEELLELSRQILDLTKAIHAETPQRPAA